MREKICAIIKNKMVKVGIQRIFIVFLNEFITVDHNFISNEKEYMSEVVSEIDNA